MIIFVEVLDNKCPSCGSKIDFNPVNQMWDCKYCGSKYSLDDMKKYDNASNTKNNSVDSNSFSGMTNYHCKNCGAEIIADDTVTATSCIYCGSTAILKEKIDSGRAPDLIIPFKRTKEEALSTFSNFTRGKPLMPKKFKDLKNIEKISGVYIPFWAYDITGDGSITFDCSDVSTWSDSNYRYTKTSKYETIVDGHYDYDKVLADGSSRFSDDLMDSIEPFNFNELKEYNHAYLSGFLAEKYNIDEETSYKRAGSRSLNTCIQLADREIHHDNSSVSKKDIKLVKKNSYYMMLPVYMVNIKYKDKIYTFAMNGQTGKMVGNIPIGVLETIIMGLIIFTVTFLIGIGISLLI